MFRKRNVVLTGTNGTSARGPTGRSKGESEPENFTHHGALRPSLITSRSCISSGSRSLDQLLQHGGIPLGSLTLIEEHGTTDFASTVLKSFAALGVVQSRAQQPTRVICVGIPEWLRALPAIAVPKATKKEDDPDNAVGTLNRMKIAWRYQRSQHMPGVMDEHHQQDLMAASGFCKDFNFKANLTPAPQSNEVGYVLGMTLADMVQQLETMLNAVPAGTVTRVVVPNLLHPAIYSPDCSLPSQLVPFYFQLRQLSRAYRTAIVVSLPLQLYSRKCPSTTSLEALSDAVIELEPFEDANVQGFVHVHKLCDLTEQGAMVQRHQEYSFKLGRFQFEVAPWGIPVEEEEDSSMF